MTAPTSRSAAAPPRPRRAGRRRSSTCRSTRARRRSTRAFDAKHAAAEGTALVDFERIAGLSAAGAARRLRLAGKGRIPRPLVRGTTVVADGRVVGPPAGRLVTPATSEES
jgi:hypothetical protein